MRRLLPTLDTERPYTGGKVGLYTEDARVRWDRVQVSG